MTQLILPNGTPPQQLLGRVPSIDERNRRHLLTPRKSITRGHRTWPNFKPILDQVGPSCVGNAGYKWLEMNPIVNNPQHTANFFYEESKKRDEWGGENYDGTSALGLMKLFQELGYVGEYKWGYSLEPVALHILDDGPALLGTWWHRGMFNPDKDGYIHPDGLKDGGHEYVGYHVNIDYKNPDKSVGRIGIINSWSDKWGIRGRAYMTFNEFDQLMRDQGDAVAATEVKKAA